MDRTHAGLDRGAHDVDVRRGRRAHTQHVGTKALDGVEVRGLGRPGTEFGGESLGGRLIEVDHCGQVDGRRFTVGGYGFPISDEGSGAALGLSAVRHALRALDGRTKRTALSDAVTERFDHQAARVVGWMDQATPADYGRFAPLVMDYAEAGDEIALSIVEDAVLHVERFIDTIFARGATRLALAGGLSTRLRPWLRGRTAARLSEPRGDPLDGALLLAGLPVGVLASRHGQIAKGP